MTNKEKAAVEEPKTEEHVEAVESNEQEVDQTVDEVKVDEVQETEPESEENTGSEETDAGEEEQTPVPEAPAPEVDKVEPKSLAEATAAIVTPPPAVAKIESPALTMFKARVGDYVKNMQPDVPRAEGECARMQLALYRAIQSALGFNGQAAFDALDYLIETVRKNRKGVFHERFYARDFQFLALPQNDRAAFDRLLRLIIVAADSNRLQDVGKEVDLKIVIDSIRDVKAQQVLLSYFSAS